MLDNAAAFLAALEENEDDEATRLIYADWLEERGQYEEAERQRKWTKAKAWIVKVLAEYHRHEFDHSFRDFCAQVHEGLERSHHARFEILSCGDNFALMGALNDNLLTFWKNWSILTGAALLEGVTERGYFGCC